MDLKQLRNFVAIVDSGSFSKAACILAVAQPSLSQQLRALEEELGTQLLQRSAQGVTPTDAGLTLYRHARNVLRQIEHIRRDVKEGGSAESGTVSVGFPTTITAILGVPLFRRLRQRYPGIRLQMFESLSGYISELLLNGRLDLAVLFRESESAGMSLSPLFDESLYVVGHGLPGDESDTCSLSQLANLPIVAPSSPHGLRLLIEQTFAHAGVDLNVAADIDSLPTLIEIARTGEAYAIIPASVLSARESEYRPPARKIINPQISRPASLCWSNTLPTSPAALAVRRCVSELVVELHDAGKWPGIALRNG
ncbi:LysR family transcriptional regulator [Burkholderia pseudomallei]|uniref:LysR substrate-binding domain-containing protein n=1 Tax=Burkholderia pseudomallei TaxID=28450 RepID=UPI001A9E5916|nr:LysR substrate-binding domain-containing protein [Burkholderia pseudomallei]MBO7776757.1 LysR family transcriptional regulator [Burkholderia pseudomallei]MBO7909652.1 LysR family transcriptional regulator [Burkholderia pseudomallei]QTB53384.1 LysR family transcriptional regulator [Burkholderia pseudomallei]